jgi:DNA-binding SARP family transcriptional activator
MRYEVLGPLRVAHESGHLSISARKIETVLAVLLIRFDQVVGIDQLANEIWGDRQPNRATAGLHVYISQLRRFLTRVGTRGDYVVTRPPGYLLTLGADEVDFLDFQKLTEQGRAFAKAGRPVEAAEVFERALALWHGPALGDLRAGPLVEGFVTWLTEARLECQEMLMDTYIEAGRHRELVGRLYSLTAENPLRETFYRQLMIALYRSERQGDALRVYQTAYRVLDEELGLEPCRALQDLQRAILAANDQLNLPATVR